LLVVELFVFSCVVRCLAIDWICAGLLSFASRKKLPLSSP
jgi:hypothetical protein